MSQIPDMSDNSEVSNRDLELTSDQIDAYKERKKAPQSTNVQLPCTNAPVLDNLAKDEDTKEVVTDKTTSPSVIEVRLLQNDITLC